MRRDYRLSLISFAILTFVLTATIVGAQDPLPSWNDTASKKAIIAFVSKVTKEGSPDFVPVAERIATIDNDGTLWVEQPIYFQALFTIDRVKALAPQHPEWKEKEPFASLLRGDMKGVLAGGEKSIVELLMVTHAGMTTAEFEQVVRDWITTAKHPKTGRLYTEMVYQPMLELLAYLRASGFKGDFVGRIFFAAGISSRERVQDIHRFRRRRRVHASLDRKGVRRSAGAGYRQQHQDKI